MEEQVFYNDPKPIFTDETIKNYLEARKVSAGRFSYKLLVTVVSIVFVMLLSNFYILNILQNANGLYTDIIEVKSKSILSLQKLKAELYMHRKLEWKLFSLSDKEEIGNNKSEIFEAENTFDYLIKDFDYINAGNEDKIVDEISLDLAEEFVEYTLVSDKIIKLYDGGQRKATKELLTGPSKLLFDKLERKLDYSSKLIQKQLDEELESAKRRSVMARNFVYAVLGVVMLATAIFVVVELNKKKNFMD